MSSVTGRDPCPCGSSQSYGACCAHLHAGTRPAPTAEAVMRARYAAFVVGDVGYLVRSWHPRTRPSRVELGDVEGWQGLEVHQATGGGADDETGEVAFTAHHRNGDVSERSRFARRGGRWVYVGPAEPGPAG